MALQETQYRNICFDDNFFKRLGQSIIILYILCIMIAMPKPKIEQTAENVEGIAEEKSTTPEEETIVPFKDTFLNAAEFDEPLMEENSYIDDSEISLYQDVGVTYSDSYINTGSVDDIKERQKTLQEYFGSVTYSEEEYNGKTIYVLSYFYNESMYITEMYQEIEDLDTYLEIEIRDFGQKYTTKELIEKYAK